MLHVATSGVKLNAVDPVTAQTSARSAVMENGKSRLQKTQEEVEEVKVIMLDNLNKADERAGKISDLEERADNLLLKSKGFEKTTVKVKQKKRWENQKMKVICMAIGIAVGAIIIGLIVYAIVESTQQ